jgi:putative addiction module component (TIGR02574 family)
MPVQTIPPIEEMTPSQKVELMEQLWESMSRRPEEVEPPEWHGELLKQREEAVRNGTDKFISLEEAEKRIREKTR